VTCYVVARKLDKARKVRHRLRDAFGTIEDVAMQGTLIETLIGGGEPGHNTDVVEEVGISTDLGFDDFVVKDSADRRFELSGVL
jgi:hypothetical protein